MNEDTVITLLHPPPISTHMVYWLTLDIVTVVLWTLKERLKLTVNF